MAGPSTLNIGIIGGGIAGLSAAIVLKRAGHNVEVSELLLFHFPEHMLERKEISGDHRLTSLQLFEKASFSNEAGVTLAIAPNAGRVYDSWGFDLKDIGGVEAFQVRLRAHPPPASTKPFEIAFTIPVLTSMRSDIWMEQPPKLHGKIP